MKHPKVVDGRGEKHQQTPFVSKQTSANHLDVKPACIDDGVTELNSLAVGQKGVIMSGSIPIHRLRHEKAVQEGLMEGRERGHLQRKKNGKGE